MKNERNNLMCGALVGLAVGMIVYICDSAVRLVKAEERAREAEEDMRSWKTIAKNLMEDRAELHAKVHELEWELNAKERES